MADFSDWKGKFDLRMAVRKNNGWAGHKLYYDEANKEAYVVHTVKDDKIDMAKTAYGELQSSWKANRNEAIWQSGSLNNTKRKKD